MARPAIPTSARDHQFEFTSPVVSQVGCTEVANLDYTFHPSTQLAYTSPDAIGPGSFATGQANNDMRGLPHGYGDLLAARPVLASAACLGSGNNAPLDTTTMPTSVFTSALVEALAGVIPASTTMPYQKKNPVKVGRHNTQFQLIAKANQWNRAERAVQLAAALKGEARLLLLDLSEFDMADPQAIARAVYGSWVSRRLSQLPDRGSMRGEAKMERNWGSMRLNFVTWPVRHSQSSARSSDFFLAKETFISGLTPDRLQEQVRLSNPSSCESALERAQEVEQVLNEGRTMRHSQISPAQPPAPSSFPQTMRTEEQAQQSPMDAQDHACWRCG